MNKREIAVLAKVYEAEINAALCPGAIHLRQFTNNKVADKLADEGYLHFAEVQLEGTLPVVVRGYELTHAGRLAYCLTCEGEA